MPQNFTTSVGRIVQGDPWTLAPQTDTDGRPKLYKSGKDQGKQMVQTYIALAIPKNDPLWPATDAVLRSESASAWPSLFPQGPTGPCALPTFSMKVIDGDDATPHIDPKTGTTWRYCDKEGFPGHWILKLSSGYLPKVYERTAAGTHIEVTDKARLKRGDYVRVAASTKSNDNIQKPGIYVNIEMIELAGTGDAILGGGLDAATAFGAAPVALPPGATPLPPAVGGFTPPAPAAAPMPTPAPAYPAVPAATPAPPSSPAAPYSGYMNAPPAAPAAPAPAAPPPIPTGAVLTPAGQAAFPGGSYEGFIAAGWTDAALRQAGYVA